MQCLIKEYTILKYSNAQIVTQSSAGTNRSQQLKVNPTSLKLASKLSHEEQRLLSLRFPKYFRGISHSPRALQEDPSARDCMHKVLGYLLIDSGP